jgi:hypothetical protein
VRVPEGEGYLLFSDPNHNVIHRMSPDGDVLAYLTKSGDTGENIGEYRQPGSNGLTLDEQFVTASCSTRISDRNCFSAHVLFNPGL